MNCPFCDRITQGELTARNEVAAAFFDAFPVSSGHSLIVPLRHEIDFFHLTGAEQAGMWRLLAEIREGLQERLSPAGFNVGINVGAAAGQTVPHTHIHLIPRYTADVPDPRGGVRWVIPDKARYW